MPKAKKKLLPKDFDALLDEGDVAKLQAVFDTCDVNARGGPSKRTALSFDRWSRCARALARRTGRGYRRRPMRTATRRCTCGPAAGAAASMCCSNSARTFTTTAASIGTPLPAADLSDMEAVVQDVKRQSGDPAQLCRLAVAWVRLNPDPLELPPPSYRR
ncbi:hypothetical protein [Burkholderia cenocepacia]|uniref:Uncharacterized protein n=1 Tax=Burkholderia cenocepacia TaxID=95486 RepID=A0A3Q9F4Y2_9BURK|nr:hypothetical protein [Burkholderia cenocepacia]AZQ52819.1 hypothetical protein D5R55_17525 [Burkholderia cenocepacia]